MEAEQTPGLQICTQSPGPGLLSTPAGSLEVPGLCNMSGPEGHLPQPSLTPLSPLLSLHQHPQTLIPI